MVHSPSHIPVVTGGSPQSFSAEMKIDLNEYGRTIIREHEVEACNINFTALAKILHCLNAALLVLRIGLMVQTPSPADIVVETAITHAEVADGKVSVNYHTEVPPPVNDPLLQQSRFMGRKMGTVPGDVSRGIDGEDGASASPPVALENQGISPG